MSRLEKDESDYYDEDGDDVCGGEGGSIFPELE